MPSVGAIAGGNSKTKSPTIVKIPPASEKKNRSTNTSAKWLVLAGLILFTIIFTSFAYLICANIRAVPLQGAEKLPIVPQVVQTSTDGFVEPGQTTLNSATSHDNQSTSATDQVYSDDPQNESFSSTLQSTGTSANINSSRHDRATYNFTYDDLQFGRDLQPYLTAVDWAIIRDVHDNRTIGTTVTDVYYGILLRSPALYDKLMAADVHRTRLAHSLSIEAASLALMSLSEAHWAYVDFLANVNSAPARVSKVVNRFVEISEQSKSEFKQVFPKTFAIFEKAAEIADN